MLNSRQCRKYKRAAERTSVARLLTLLSEMRLVYPYEKAIGFYLDQAGVADAELDKLRSKTFRFSFYIAHGIHELDYVSAWRLFVPKGLKPTDE